jgi:hypothetical protein
MFPESIPRGITPWNIENGIIDHWDEALAKLTAKIHMTVALTSLPMHRR